MIQFSNNEEASKYLQFLDLINKDPNAEPFVPLISYESWSLEDSYTFEYVGHRSAMINLGSKEIVFKLLDYSDLLFTGTGYFEEDSSGKRVYITGESWNYDDIIIEPLYVNREWSGLDLSITEPSQRLVFYLDLVQHGEEWKDPYNNEIIMRRIKKEEMQNSVKHNISKIEIKIDYLKDYLSARASGLYIIKFARRDLFFDSPDDIPLKPETRNVKNGQWHFFCSTDRSYISMITDKNVFCGAELFQKYWIEPFEKPRRWDAIRRGEFESGTVFTLYDGTKREYDVSSGHNKDYWTLISFNPRVIELFLNRINFDYEEYSRETLGLKFPTGEILHVAINLSGQIQSWWGQIAKLPKRYQQLLAQYSESWKEKLPARHDYLRITVHGHFPETKPLRKTLQELKTEINSYFLSRYDETFFNKRSSLSDLKRVYEPYEMDPHQLLDVMEYLDKWLFSEEKPEKIIDAYNLREKIRNPREIRSLGVLKLVFRKIFGDALGESKTQILNKIKDLRHCKAHYMELSKIIEKHNYKDRTPQETYREIIQDLEDLLDWFSAQCKQNKFHVDML